MEHPDGSRFTKIFLAGFLSILGLSAFSLLGAFLLPAYLTWLLAAMIAASLVVVIAIEVLVAAINLVFPEKERKIWDAREARVRLLGLLLALLIGIPVLAATCQLNYDTFCTRQPEEETYLVCQPSAILAPNA